MPWSFLFCAALWAQILPPIVTHRPTQGINTSLIEKNALQIELGHHPLLLSGKSKVYESVLQVRKGLDPRLEIFGTSVFRTPDGKFSSLSFSVKVPIYHRAFLQVASSGWFFLPISPTGGGGQLWLLVDKPVFGRGILTLNGVVGYFPAGGQVFFTAFYTHMLTPRWAAWVEGFTYLPAAPGEKNARHGLGVGTQLLLGKRRYTAIDAAWNSSWTLPQGDALPQLLFGISQKIQTTRRL
ncbi:MAG: hypothetical protein N2170_09330 [Bacteroidia bacterium]|nr:hypothetical protein [Bacteroidia bacterium]